MKNPKYPKKRRPKAKPGSARRSKDSAATAGTITMEGGIAAEFRSNLTMPCRCGLAVAFGYMGDMATGMHAEPRCLEFETMELLDYMRWLRGNIEKSN